MGALLSRRVPTTKLPIYALPAIVREEIFLHLESTDLNECQTVNAAWRDFIANTVKRSKCYVEAVQATKRLVFGEIVNEGEEVEVEGRDAQIACDESGKMIYTLAHASGNVWILKQYSCRNGLHELQTVTLIGHPIGGMLNMEVVDGHLIIFSEFRQHTRTKYEYMTSVFSVASLPWGGRLSITNGMQLPGVSFHLSKLLLGRSCLFTVSKNAYVTWTWKAKDEWFNDIFTKETHQSFEKSINRPVIVHKFSKQSGTTWKEVAKLYPVHEFRVMEMFSNQPNRVPYPKYYKDQACILHLSNDIINESYMLVSCPLHGSYQMFDYVRNFSMWQLSLAQQLPFGIIRYLLHCSPPPLAAIRRDYVFIYAERGSATLVSLQEGKARYKVKGDTFVLGPRYVLAAAHSYSRPLYRVAVVDSASGAISPTFTIPRPILVFRHSYSVHYLPSNIMPWQDDDDVYASFAAIMKQLPADGLTRPLQRRAKTSNGGHVMLDSHRIVHWAPWSTNKLKIAMGYLKLDEDKA